MSTIDNIISMPEDKLKKFILNLMHVEHLKTRLLSNTIETIEIVMDEGNLMPYQKNLLLSQIKRNKKELGIIE